MAPRASRRSISSREPKFEPIRQQQNSKSRPSNSLRQPASRFFLLILAVSLLAVFCFFLFKHTSSSESQEWSVYNKGLVTSDLSYKAILSEFGSLGIDRTKRHFNTTVLAYVTPWNSKGYDMAKHFRSKFTHVSPVWYQLKCGDTLELHGRHDVDRGWIDSVRIKGQPRIFPRITLEGWPMDAMLVQPDEKKRAISLISSECKMMHYDGIVLEAWSAWAATDILQNPILRERALHFVRDLGYALHRVQVPRPQFNLQLIFVIPPPSTRKSASQFTASDLKMLGNAVDGFSLMTYDFSNPYHPGPNAPFQWVHSCLHLLLGNVSARDDKAEDNLAPKILMGLNFYGNDYTLPSGGSPIVGDQYVSLLRKYKPTLLWDDEAKEHYLEYTDARRKHVVYYPSLKSLALRLEKASAWGVGISIWEIGQGLEYFFDLL